MKYYYRVFNPVKKKVVEDKIDGENQETVINFLKQKGNLIIEIKPFENLFDKIKKLIHDNVSANDVVDFTRQIAIMTNSGLSLIDSLNILKKQITKLSFLKLINQIEEDIKAGSSFSQSLQKHPQIFNRLYLALIRSGEKSGKLDEILTNLANDLEKKREINSKIKSALAYPILILITMGIVMFIMFSFVIPQLLGIFKEMNLSLPITTKIIMAISFFMQKNWLKVLFIILIVIILLKKILSDEKKRRIIDKKMLEIPYFSKLVKMSNLVNTTRTLSILTRAGVSILESLEIISDATPNIIYKNSFQQIYKKVEKGESLSRSFSENEEIFPQILIQMIQVGEETGRLDETLERIAQYFEIETEMNIKMIMSLIEPILLIILGIGVGFLVISVISPIYQLTGSIK